MCKQIGNLNSKIRLRKVSTSMTHELAAHLHAPSLPSLSNCRPTNVPFISYRPLSKLVAVDVEEPWWVQRMWSPLATASPGKHHQAFSFYPLCYLFTSHTNHMPFSSPFRLSSFSFSARSIKVTAQPLKHSGNSGRLHPPFGN